MHGVDPLGRGQSTIIGAGDVGGDGCCTEIEADLTRGEGCNSGSGGEH